MRRRFAKYIMSEREYDACERAVQRAVADWQKENCSPPHITSEIDDLVQSVMDAIAERCDR